jgi:hypothetical protein
MRPSLDSEIENYKNVLLISHNLITAHLRIFANFCYNEPEIRENGMDVREMNEMEMQVKHNMEKIIGDLSETVKEIEGMQTMMLSGETRTEALSDEITDYDQLYKRDKATEPEAEMAGQMSRRDDSGDNSGNNLRNEWLSKSTYCVPLRRF